MTDLEKCEFILERWYIEYEKYEADFGFLVVPALRERTDGMAFDLEENFIGHIELH